MNRSYPLFLYTCDYFQFISFFIYFLGKSKSAKATLAAVEC